MEGTDSESVIHYGSQILGVIGVLLACSGFLMVVLPIGQEAINGYGWVFLFIGLVLILPVTFVGPDSDEEDQEAT